jgi:ubiquinone/menaquinone biosynthesis C-methylase UbiE
MATETNSRLPHAVLNLETRHQKAKKIELIVAKLISTQPIHLLEIGTGSGGIASYFARNSEYHYKVSAIDLIDNRLVKDGFEFQLVKGTQLPYDNEIFDMVISNHVIEHVGDWDAQINHLQEIARVLKRGGIAYLAVPNRWMLIEPHYKLIFLSWLPRKIRTPYLKLFGRGNYYDCEPLQKHEIEFMFKKVNLLFENQCVRALRLTFDIEAPNSFWAKLLKFVPDRLLNFFVPIIPTLIYTVKKIE